MSAEHSVAKRKSSFRGDVLRLASGTALAQLIVLAATPVLTRLFAPEAFGVAAMFMALTGVAGVVACLRYELSIVLPESDREAANLLALSLLVALIVSAVVGFVALFAGPLILRWINMSELAPYLWLIPVYILVHGVFLGLNYWNTRTKHFKRLAASRVAGSVATTTGSLSAGFLGHATGGAMVAANVGGQAIATAALGGQIWRSDRRFILANVAWQEMLRGLGRYRKFPLLSAPGGLLNVASWQMPVLILGAVFSPQIAGLYSLGFRVFQMPMSLVGRSISQVFHQQAAEARRQGHLGEVVSDLLTKLFALGAFPMMLLAAIGADLFAVVFGYEWRQAGVYTQILAPWALVWFVSSPLSNIFGVIGSQEQGLAVQSLIFFSRLISLFIGGFLNSALLAIALFAISGILVYGYLMWLIARQSGASPSSLMIGGLKEVARTLPFILWPALAAAFAGNAIVTLVIAFVCSALFLLLHRKRLRLVLQETGVGAKAAA